MSLRTSMDGRDHGPPMQWISRTAADGWHVRHGLLNGVGCDVP